ncbi:MAG TPA: cyclase family protein [Bryobacteraceae bacterium]|nr:cyclase family protein [Bryobacteraceae bacterium]
MNDLLGLLRRSRVFDLAQPYFVGMPHFPTHPPFLFGLTKKHGDLVTEGGVSSAADSIALGSHVGTHIDALAHFSCGGKLHGGIEARSVQSNGGGVLKHSVDTIAPILRRGVLIDVAGHLGQDALPADFAITSGHLESAVKAQNVAIGKGDVVLLRTGWARFWNDAARYITGGKGTVARGPGPELDAARWLSGQGVFAAGSDTVAFERVPAAEMPVHVHLLVENGIHILEALNLEEISREHVYEFVLLAVPLKIRGATGSPIRPLALA